MKSFRRIRGFAPNCFMFPRITPHSRPSLALIISIPSAITSPKTHAEHDHQAAAPLAPLVSIAAESKNTIKKATAARNASTYSTRSPHRRLFVRTALLQTVSPHAIAANALLATLPTMNRFTRSCHRGNCNPPSKLNDRFFSNTSISI